jgi:hypothetical protein
MEGNQKKEQRHKTGFVDIEKELWHLLFAGLVVKIID